MEVLANPEFLPPVTYIPLGLSQVTRNSYNGGIHLPTTHAIPLRYSRREKLSLSAQKLKGFFKRTHRDNLEANSDFIFYTTNSKSHLQPRRVQAKTILPADSHSHRERNEIVRRPSSRRSSCNLVDLLRTLLVFIWILMFSWIVVYSVVRCHQLEGCSYLLTTTEGSIVLAVLALTFVAGIAIVVILAMCKPKEEYSFGEELNRHRVSLETQV